MLEQQHSKAVKNGENFESVVEKNCDAGPLRAGV